MNISDRIKESNKRVKEVEEQAKRRVEKANQIIQDIYTNGIFVNDCDNDELFKSVGLYEFKLETNQNMNNDKLLSLQNLVIKKINEINNQQFQTVKFDYDEESNIVTIQFLGVIKLFTKEVVDKTLQLENVKKVTSIKKLQTFYDTDLYQYWVYPKDINDVSNPFYYNCPSKKYAELLFESDPFLGDDRYKKYTIGKIETSNNLVYVSNDPIYTLAKLYKYKSNTSFLVNPTINRNKKRNVLLIFFDQFNSWSNLPESFTSKLKGYQAFKKIGIEFTSMYNNRQMCSPSRSVFMTGKINTGVIDNIDQSYQYDAVPHLDNFNTSGHIFKNANYDVTAYYGKSHFDSRMAPGEFFSPTHNIATTGAMKGIGFDRHGEFGDDFYEEKHAYVSDDRIFEKKSMIGTSDNEVYDIEIDGEKYQGMLPFLKARKLDNKSFHAQFHFTNPHDIMHVYHNPTEKPNNDVMTFSFPFYEEQVKEFGIKPNYYNEENPDSSSKNENFNLNFFEDNWEDYKNNKESLLYYQSFLNDYATDIEKYNSKYPFIEGAYIGLKNAFTMADKSQIVFWKNFQNIYLSMIHHVDTYLFKIYNYMEKNDLFSNTAVIITADHGEMAGAHGLKQKGMPFKNSTNIPLLICSPDLDISLRNTTNNSIVNSYDINHTLATLGMFPNPKLENMIGTSILSKSDDKLIINSEIKNENFGIINNWMNFVTGVVYMTSQPDTTNVLNPLSSPFDYLFMCCHHLKRINNIEYNYALWWSPKTILDSKRENFSITRILKLSQKENIYSLLEDAIPELKELPDKFKNKIKLIFKKDNPSLLDFINTNNYCNEIPLFKIFIGLIIIGLLPFSAENNDINSNNFMQTLKNKRSVAINMELPFYNLSHQEMQEKIKEGLYLEMLYNRNNDPDEVYNLMDPKYPDIVSKNNNVSEHMFDNIKEKSNINLIDFRKTITPIMNTFALNIFKFIISLLKKGDNYKLTNIDKNILMSMHGHNNMDSPHYELNILKMIAGNNIKS